MCSDSAVLLTQSCQSIGSRVNTKPRFHSLFVCAAVAFNESLAGAVSHWLMTGVQHPHNYRVRVPFGAILPLEGKTNTFYHLFKMIVFYYVFSKLFFFSFFFLHNYLNKSRMSCDPLRNELICSNCVMFMSIVVCGSSKTMQLVKDSWSVIGAKSKFI